MKILQCLILCLLLLSCDNLTTTVEPDVDLEQVYYLAQNKLNFSDYKELAIHRDRISFSNIFYIVNSHTMEDSYTKFYLHKTKLDGASLDFGYNCKLNDTNINRIKFSNSIEFETGFNSLDYLEDNSFAGKTHRFIATASKQINEINTEIKIKPLLRFTVNKTLTKIQDLGNFTVIFDQKLEAKNTIFGLIFEEDSGKKRFFNLQFLHDTDKIYLKDDMLTDFKKEIMNEKGILHFYLYYLEQTDKSIVALDKSNVTYNIPIIYKSIYSKKILEIL
jgi:hypothetical protein